LIEIPNYKNIEPVKKILIHRISYCIKSLHFQVADKALNLVCNSKILEMIENNGDELLFEILKGIISSTESHWNE